MCLFFQPKPGVFFLTAIPETPQGSRSPDELFYISDTATRTKGSASQLLIPVTPVLLIAFQGLAQGQVAGTK